MNLSGNNYKILYATQDAGPAEYLSRIIQANSEPYACYSSLKSSRIFDKYGIMQLNSIDWNEIKSVSNKRLWRRQLGQCIA